MRHGLAGLEDVARSGPKLKFGSVTHLELIVLACEPVPAAGQTTRTIDGLVDEATARGPVERISRSSYQRILSGYPLQAGAAMDLAA